MYFVILLTFFGALGLLAGIWILALLRCWGNLRLGRVEKERWLIFIALTPPIGAIIYFLRHRHDPELLNIHLHR